MIKFENLATAPGTCRPWLPVLIYNRLFRDVTKLNTKIYDFKCVLDLNRK